MTTHAHASVVDVPTGTPAPAPELVDALANAMRLAALAPSSHNSQPWALAVATAGFLHARLAAHVAKTGARVGDAPLLVLGLDRSRALGSLDAHAIEMDLSCGAYLHALLEALAADGWEPGCVHVDDDGVLGHVLERPWPTSWEPLAVIALRPSASSPERRTALTRALFARVTNRAPFADAAIAPATLARVRRVSTRIAPELVFDARVATDREIIGATASVVREHAPRDFVHDAAWRETYAFIHWSDASAARAERGFPITQLLGPMPAWKQRAVQAVLAPASLSVLKRVGLARFLGHSLADLVGASRAVVSLELPARASSRRARIAAGGAMMDFWLRATELGLAVHPVSVVLQHDDARRALESAVGAAGRVFFFARVGRATTEFPRAPRVREPERHVVLL